jgi:hypothetical protein
MENYLLLFAGAFYLLGAASLFLSAGLRKWIWTSGSILFLSILSGVALLSELSLFSNPVEVKITNYSSNSGILYFLKESNEGRRILYDLSVNRNEESCIEVESEGGGYDKVLFVSKEEIYQVPVQEQEYRQLEIWEKELKPVDASYRVVLENWQQGQQIYSLAVGLMLFWFLLHLFYLAWQKKRRERMAPAPAGKNIRQQER